jgi:hypothetical protein
MTMGGKIVGLGKQHGKRRYSYERDTAKEETYSFFSTTSSDFFKKSLGTAVSNRPTVPILYDRCVSSTGGITNGRGKPKY